MKDRERYAFMEEHPQPTNAVEALAHTLAVYEELDDDRQMVQATSGIYGPGVRTGLTMGDLREIAALMGRLAREDGAVRHA